MRFGVFKGYFGKNKVKENNKIPEESCHDE
jgi:hypothetical protein